MVMVLNFVSAETRFRPFLTPPSITSFVASFVASFTTPFLINTLHITATTFLIIYPFFEAFVIIVRTSGCRLGRW